MPVDPDPAGVEPDNRLAQISAYNHRFARVDVEPQAAVSVDEINTDAGQRLGRR
jgi:hypothetical protein